MFRLMKGIKVSLFIGLLSVLAITSCGESDSVKPHKQSRQAKAGHSVTFSKGRVIEIGFAAIKKGKGKQLGLYFQKVMPLFKEYGGKPLAVLNVVSVPYGDKKPHIFGLFEWPSVKAFLKFQKDPRFLKVKKIRDGALSYISSGHFFRVKKDVTVTFRGDKMYELWAAWIKRKGDKNIKKYSRKVRRIARRHGQKKLVVLHPVRLKKRTSRKLQAVCHNPDNFTPDMAGLVEWPSSRAYKDFTSERKFKKAVRLRKKATKRFEAIHGKLPPPPKR